MFPIVTFPLFILLPRFPFFLSRQAWSKFLFTYFSFSCFLCLRDVWSDIRFNLPPATQFPVFLFFKSLYFYSNLYIFITIPIFWRQVWSDLRLPLQRRNFLLQSLPEASQRLSSSCFFFLTLSIMSTSWCFFFYKITLWEQTHRLMQVLTFFYKQHSCWEDNAPLEQKVWDVYPHFLFNFITQLGKTCCWDLSARNCPNFSPLDIPRAQTIWRGVENFNSFRKIKFL